MADVDGVAPTTERATGQRRPRVAARQRKVRGDMQYTCSRSFDTNNKNINQPPYIIYLPMHPAPWWPRSTPESRSHAGPPAATADRGRPMARVARMRCCFATVSVVVFVVVGAWSVAWALD